MLGDGVLTAFIPWLEVLPGYQGQGIGAELMRRILDGTDRFYSVDLVCDADQGRCHGGQEPDFCNTGTVSNAICAPGTGRSVVNPRFHHTRRY